MGQHGGGCDKTVPYAKLIDDSPVYVGQKQKLKPTATCQIGRRANRFRTDCDHHPPAVGQPRKVRLDLVTKISNTIRTPMSAIENNDRMPTPQPIRKAKNTTTVVGKREIIRNEIGR